jgi:SAM-dependent methyltransferase
MPNNNKAPTYNEKYRGACYFKYRNWLYRPFAEALIRKAKLRQGSSILDVGCGQGFFTSLFADLGLKSVGVDISEEGIRFAEREYGKSGAIFAVGNVLSLGCEGHYDCVFVRGLSLYNSTEFKRTRSTTDILLTYLKPGGVLVFNYHTKLSPKRKSETWVYHSLSDVAEHFSAYPGARIYFSLRVETLVLGTWAFCFPFTFSTALISRTTGVGGELIVFVPRPDLSMAQSHEGLPSH